jgi:hypothetical protein
MTVSLTILRTSFFGTQEGDFSLSIRSISALKEVPDATATIISKDLEKGLPAGGFAQTGSRGTTTIVLIAALCLIALYHYAGRRAC